MKLKFILLTILAIFLISEASAILVYADWEDGTQSTTITQGESISFNADFTSIKPSANIYVELYRNSLLLYSFESNTKINLNSYFNTYEITPEMYGEVGNYRIIVRGYDSRPDYDVHVLYLNVNPNLDNLEIVSIPVYSVYENESYEYQVKVDGGIEPYSYSLTGASWLSIDNSGLISGNPENLGGETYSISVRVEDNFGNEVYQNYILNVLDVDEEENVPLNITSNPITVVNENTPYTYQVEVEGGIEPYVYSLDTSVSFLHLSNPGFIWGTTPNVTQDTNYSISVIVRDNYPNSDFNVTTQTFILTVLNVENEMDSLNITSSPIEEINETEYYEYQIEVEGGIGEYTYSFVFPDTMANWLEINNETGLVNGTAPNVTGNHTYQVSIKVEDENGNEMYQNFSLKVIDLDEEDEEDDDDDHYYDDDENETKSSTRYIDLGDSDLEDLFFNQTNETISLNEIPKVEKKSLDNSLVWLVFFTLFLGVILISLLLKKIVDEKNSYTVR
jgi:hypothetical protein